MAGITANYVSPSGFTVITNRTDEFTVDRRVKANCGIDGYKFCTITSSSYSNPNTTINLTATSDNLTSNLTDVYYGISEGLSGSVPIHNHNGNEGSGGGISQLVASDGNPDPALSVDADGNINTNGTNITINGLGSGNRHSYINLVGDDTYTDYGFRIIRGNGGANAVTTLYHKGTGDYEIRASEAANILFKTNNFTKMTIASDGRLTLTSGTGINEFSTDGTLSGNSDNAVPTEKAVKTYSDSVSGGIANIVTDTTPQLGGDLDLNGHNINYTSILTSNSTYEGTIMTVTVDSSAAAFSNALYCAADFHYELTSASTSATMPCRVLALESGTGEKKVLLEGQICNTTWNWSNSDIYVSETTGELTSISPSGSGDQVQKVGWSLSADTIYFRPDSTIIEIT